jgi:ADP-heptose:LPS heptosyltransferase
MAPNEAAAPVGPIRPPTPTVPEEGMQRYLIVQLARFGDLVQTKRLLRSLAGPKREVHLCLDRSIVPLARILFPEVILHGIIAHRSHGNAWKTLLENRPVFDLLAETTFDTVYNLNFSPLNFRLSSLFDPEIVRGYKSKNGQDLIDSWAALAMRWSKDRRIGLNLIDFWAGYVPHPCAPERVNPEAVPRGNGIGVVMAGRESRRSLPVPVLGPILRTAWMKNGRNRVVLLGTTGESAAARALIKDMPPDLREKTVDLTGKTDWSALVEEVSGLDSLLTPDTGIMHLAAHLGVPVIAFFLSSAWCHETGPYGLGHTVYQAILPCLPCLEHQACPHGLQCQSPFSTPEFLRLLSTEKASHALPGLLGMRSRLDPLGGTYSCFAGDDPDAPRRAAFRHFVADHQGAKGELPSKQEDASFAQTFYRERDWLLPSAQKQTFPF